MDTNPEAFPQEFKVDNEKGILEREGIFVHTPSPFARENLFYVRLEALYTCSEVYEVRRQDLEAFLLFFIRDGKMLFEYEGRSFVAQSGDVVFLDCRRPHYYHALARTRFYWFHFEGAASRAYYERFRQNGGICFRDYRSMEEYFVLVHDMMRGDFPDEGMMSVHVHRILALLHSSLGKKKASSDVVTKARFYMEEHFMEKVTTEDLAALLNLSQSHFFRVFREETEMTPYAYLMNVRLDHAMKMLLETPRSVEEIAQYCAFCSATNFIRAFRTSTGITPRKFRKLINGVTSAG